MRRADRPIRGCAIRHSAKVWVHAGSLVERIPGDARVYNTTVVFDREGREVARYRKINMFDIVAPDGTQYRESATVKPGTEIMTYDLEGFRIGGAICFDLRFYAIFEEMMRRNVDIIALPGSIHVANRKDHWGCFAGRGRLKRKHIFSRLARPAPIGSPANAA